MSKLRRLSSRKPYSWWWDSHISPQNSKWLADNLEETDKLVKQMLKLLEQEGDSFAKKAEIYYESRPELIAHVEDFYRMYRALAEKYDSVTGELLRSMTSSKSHSKGTSTPSSSKHGPIGHKPPKPKPRHRAAGFDVFLGSSDASRKGSDSSSTTSSDSESDSNDPLEEIDNVDGDVQQQQHIVDLENKLEDAMEQLRVSEEETTRAKRELEALQRTGAKEVRDHGRILEVENEVTSLHEGLRISKEHAPRDLPNEKDKGLRGILEERPVGPKVGTARDSTQGDVEALMLQEKVVILEAEATRLKGQTEDLRALHAAIIDQSNAKIAAMNLSIEELNSKLECAKELHRDLDVEIAKRDRILDEVKAAMQKEVEGLHQKVEELEAKLEVSMSEKMEVDEKASGLSAEVDAREGRMREMDAHLHRLHLEHVRLIEEVEAARREGKRVRARAKELEAEVRRQRAELWEGAEGKREAIRQLCFSMEHYRSGYDEIRRALLRGNKRISQPL